MFIFESESEHVGAGKGWRERETKNQSKLYSVSAEPDVGLKLTNCEIII